jgi:hypothetical protein
MPVRQEKELLKKGKGIFKKILAPTLGLGE